MNFAAFLKAVSKLVSRVTRCSGLNEHSQPQAENVLRREHESQPAASPAPPVSRATKQRKWLSIYNEELWTRLD